MAQNQESGYTKLETGSDPVVPCSATTQETASTPLTNQQNAPPPQVITAPQIKPREAHKNVLFKLGIVEAIFGILSIILCVVTLIISSVNSSYMEWSTYDERYEESRITYGATFVATGIWCGLPMLASGILGIKAKQYPTACIYRANMAFSIVASVLMAIQCIISGVSTITVYPDKFVYILLPYHVILCLIGLVGMIICIVHSAYCCAGICCRNKSHRQQGAVLRVQQPGQMVRLANGQYMVVNAGAPQTYPAVPMTGVSYPAGQMPPGSTMPVVQSGQMPPQGVVGAPPCPPTGPTYYHQAPPGQMPTQQFGAPTGSVYPHQAPGAPVTHMSPPQVAPTAPYPTMPNPNPPAYPTQQPPFNPAI